jgi:glycerol uptake facilitator protein
VSLAVVRRFPWRDVLPYVVAQLVGAVIGAVVVVAIFGSHVTGFNASGGTVVGAGFTKGQAVAAEALGTFLLVATIMALAVDRRAPAGFAGLVIGLAVACEIMVIGPISGGSVNPARTFGPYVATEIFGGSTPWSQFWIYVVGPVAGGAAAALAYDLIVQPERAAAAAAEPAQGTAGDIVGRRVVPEEQPARAERESPAKGERPMAGNKAVAYIEPGKVEVQSIDYPKLELQDGPGVHPDNVGRKASHGAIIKIVATNICGSDQHMVRGRTTAPAGLVLGHEITGEVIETGPTSSSSRRATWSPCPSTSPAAAAACARRATPACA